ncbi:helix-turn-helix transcriptional regulator [Spirosoma pulveris]
MVDSICDVRIKLVAQLLSTTSLRVSEIANLADFDDLKHFRKTFQGLYSLLSSDYTRQYGQGAIN